MCLGNESLVIGTRNSSADEIANVNFLVIRNDIFDRLSVADSTAWNSLSSYLYSVDNTATFRRYLETQTYILNNV